MADLFSGLPVPRIDWSGQNGSASRALLAGAQVGLQRREQDFREKKTKQEFDLWQQQQSGIKAATNEMLGSLAESHIENEEGMSNWLAKNPKYAIHPYTAPLVKNLATVFSNMTRTKIAAEKSEIDILKAKSELGMEKAFWTDYSKIDPLYRSAISGMGFDKDGRPTANQFEAMRTVLTRPDAIAPTTAEKVAALRDENKTYNVPPGAKVINSKGEVLFDNPSAAAQALETITEKIPAEPDVEAQPAQPPGFISGLFGGKGTPAVPAKKGHGEITIKKTVKPGKSPAAPKSRVRVKGPGGATGTIEEGDTLPNGWELE